MMGNLQNAGMTAAAATTAGGVLFLSQLDTSQMPSGSQVSQFTALGVCLFLLYWIITKRQPESDKQHAETIKYVVDTHRDALKDAGDTHREVFTEMKTGQAEIVTAIRDGNETQHQLLRETILTKRAIQDKPKPDGGSSIEKKP